VRGRATCGGASKILPLRRSLHRAVSATVAGARVTFPVGLDGMEHTRWPVGAGTRGCVGADPQPTWRVGGDTGGGAAVGLYGRRLQQLGLVPSAPRRFEARWATTAVFLHDRFALRAHATCRNLCPLLFFP